VQGIEAEVSKHNDGGPIKPNFIKRLEDPNRKHIMDWEDPRRIATHKMGHEYYPDDSGRAIVYPNVQEIGEKTNNHNVIITRPSYQKSSKSQEQFEKEWAEYERQQLNKSDKDVVEKLPYYPERDTATILLLKNPMYRYLGGPIKPIVGKVSGVQRSSINNNQDYFEQHFTTELDGGTNYSGIMGNNEYFVRKTPDGKYMYDIQGEDGTIFQGENESSLPIDARKFLDSLYNVGTRRFSIKRQNNGGPIKPNFIQRLEEARK
jgi:hypothetical protein